MTILKINHKANYLFYTPDERSKMESNKFVAYT